MRIGIVGAAGTGKTTLARALGHELGCSLVPDFVPIVLREHGKESWKDVHDWRTSRIVRFSAVERKIAGERGHAAFVSDRTVVDYLAYWLHNQAEHESKEQNAAFLAMVKDHVARYDLCIYLPWRESIEPGSYRSTDPMHNLRIASMKRGLLSTLGVKTVEAPFTFGEDVKAWIARWVTPAPPPAPAPAALPPAAAPALSPLAAMPEIDEEELVRRVVEHACRALADRQEPEAEKADDGEVWKLDRRVEKLARALSETEERLRGMIAAKTVDTGVPSVYKAVQGLSSDDANFERKRGLLQEVFQQNVALHERAVARKAAAKSAAVATALAAPPLAAVAVEERARGAAAGDRGLVDEVTFHEGEKAF